MASLIGVGDTNAYASPDRFEIHTIWPEDNHEVVHLYASVWGRPGALWSEGLAVAFQTDPQAGDFTARWSGVPLDHHAERFLSEGRLIPIADLLTTSDFRRFDSNVTYPEAGSFMTFVIATCGLEGVKQLFVSGTANDPALVVRQKFQGACGRAISDVEADWRQMLGGQAAGVDAAAELRTPTFPHPPLRWLPFALQ
jgi:hypothetical protein